MNYGSAVAVGIGCAVALGIALDNYGLGILIGVFLGCALAGATHARRNKAPPSDGT
jgi:uncharacterized membrane protein YccC